MTAPTFDWHALPTLPGHWPVLGHRLSALWSVPAIFDALERDPRPLFRYRPPGSPPAVFWNAPEAIDLFKNRFSTSAHLEDFGEVITGRSMISADGPPHRHVRKAANRPFSPAGLTRSGVIALIDEIVTAHAERLAATDGFVVLRETQAVALEIIFRIIGVPPGQVTAWGNAYRRLLVGGSGPRVEWPLLPMWWARRARKWIDDRLRG